MSAHSEYDWSPRATAVYLLKLLQLRGSVARADTVIVQRYLQQLTSAAGRAHDLHTPGSQLQSEDCGTSTVHSRKKDEVLI